MASPSGWITTIKERLTWAAKGTNAGTSAASVAAGHSDSALGSDTDNTSTISTTSAFNAKAWRYLEDLPEDKHNLALIWKLLRSYSGIPSRQIEGHIREVVSPTQDQATGILRRLFRPVEVASCERKTPTSLRIEVDCSGHKSLVALMFWAIFSNANEKADLGCSVRRHGRHSHMPGSGDGGFWTCT